MSASSFSSRWKVLQQSKLGADARIKHDEYLNLMDVSCMSETFLWACGRSWKVRCEFALIHGNILHIGYRGGWWSLNGFTDPPVNDMQTNTLSVSPLSSSPCLRLFVALFSWPRLIFLELTYCTGDIKSSKCQTNFVSQIVVHSARQNYVIIVVLTGPLVIKTWWLTWVELALLAPHNAFIPW